MFPYIGYSKAVMNCMKNCKFIRKWRESENERERERERESERMSNIRDF